jgi:hypothetical protein
MCRGFEPQVSRDTGYDLINLDTTQFSLAVKMGGEPSEPYQD